MTKQVKKSLGKLTKNLKSFSLVELIIVIAIIAILSVAGFMTLTKWIGKARDSRRVSDLQTIQKALTYNYMDSSNEEYPLPDGKQLITGSKGEQLWYQGVFGNEAVKEVSSLSKAPKDPNGDNYEYSVTADQKTWEAYAILEDGEKVSYINQVYAGEGKVIKRGNYKGYIMGATGDMLYNPASMYLTSGTQLTTGSNNDIYQENENVGTSQIVTGMVVTDTTTASDIATEFGITEQEAEIAVNDAANGGSVSVESSSDEGGDAGNSELITQTQCESAGWYRVSSSQDTMGDGYCISPRVEANGDTDGIAWNDAGTSYGWNDTSYAGNEGSLNEGYGITAYFSPYTCKDIGSATTDYDTTDGNGDTIHNRMKWIASFANMNNNESELNSIDWIDINLNTSNTQSIPAMYIADCIDGTKDIEQDMTLPALASSTSTDETITWSDYTSTTDSDTTRDDRNKYLLGWAYKAGSHLPSAYSHMNSAYTDDLSTDKGEYQIACEAGKFSQSDNTDNERIWLASVDHTDGSYRGRRARTIGTEGCGDHSGRNAGARHGYMSARFVVRP